MSTAETVSNGGTPPLWQLLISIIDKPAATFGAVLARRKWYMWAVPVLVLILCFGVLTVVQVPYTAEIQQQQLERRLATMPAGQAEEARAAMEEMQDVAWFKVFQGVMMALTIVAVPLIGIVGQAAILYFGALLAGGEVDFGSVFTMSSWTQLPLAIHSLVQAGFVVIARRLIQAPGLSALVATGDLMQDASNPIFALLGRLDPFWLWHLFLVVVGLSVVAGFSRKKSLVLALIYAALALAVGLLLSLLAGLFGGVGG